MVYCSRDCCLCQAHFIESILDSGETTPTPSTSPPPDIHIRISTNNTTTMPRRRKWIACWSSSSAGSIVPCWGVSRLRAALRQILRQFRHHVHSPFANTIAWKLRLIAVLDTILDLHYLADGGRVYVHITDVVSVSCGERLEGLSRTG